MDLVASDAGNSAVVEPLPSMGARNPKAGLSVNPNERKPNLPVEPELLRLNTLKSAFYMQAGFCERKL